MTKIYSFLAWVVIYLWSATLKVYKENLGAEPHGKAIFAFRHGEQFALYRSHRNRGIAIMTSLSRDGELQNGILRRFGYSTVRGSSSRGGARALIGMLDVLRRGFSAAFAVDGPRGPVNEVKPGVVYLAMKTGVPIIPMRVFYSSAKKLQKAWDEYLLPAPFSSVRIVYGPPVPAAPGLGENDIAAKCREIEQIMDTLAPRRIL